MNSITSFHRLHFYEAVFGPLIEVKDEDEGIVALIGKDPIWFPEYVKEGLSHYLGQRVAILRTDIKDKTYLIRLLPSENSPTSQMALQCDQGRS